MKLVIWSGCITVKEGTWFSERLVSTKWHLGIKICLTFRSQVWVPKGLITYSGSNNTTSDWLVANIATFLESGDWHKSTDLQDALLLNEQQLMIPSSAQNTQTDKSLSLMQQSRSEHWSAEPCPNTLQPHSSVCLTSVIASTYDPWHMLQPERKSACK